MKVVKRCSFVFKKEILTIFCVIKWRNVAFMDLDAIVFHEILKPKN